MNEFNEIKARILASNYKYIALFRGSEKICAWNGATKTRDAKLDEIEYRLNDIAPGVYQILCRNSTAEKNPVAFHINTGTENSPQPIPPAPIFYQDKGSDKLLENKEILNLTVQLKQLEIENNFLRKQIAELEKELDELEAAAETNLAEATPAPTLMESAKGFFETLMEFGAPLLDQHFALKKAQIEIEREKLQGRQAPAPGSQQAQTDQNIIIRKIGEWVETYKDQTEIYEMLHAISANSKTVNDFLAQLNNINPELYNEIREQI